MMLPLVHKLWDKGVDIGAGVITSVFIAIIGLLSWRVKLWFDLRADKAKFVQLKQLERQHGHEQEKARRLALIEQRAVRRGILSKKLTEGWHITIRERDEKA